MQTTQASTENRSSGLHPLAVPAAILSGAALIVSVVFLTIGIVGFNKSSQRERWVFREILDREINYSDRSVTLTDETAEGTETLVINYGPDVLRLRPTLSPYDEAVPTLGRHGTWMRLLVMVERSGLSDSKIDAGLNDGTLPHRLVLVTRSQPAGADEESWGRTWKKHWWFDYYTFLPDGGFEHERGTYPSKYDNRQTDMEQGSWQMIAALCVMPQLGSIPGMGGPTPAYQNDALYSVGWPFPATFVSGVAFTIAMATLIGRAGRERALPASA